jgi:Protein of unknown function (DUF2909)
MTALIGGVFAAIVFSLGKGLFHMTRGGQSDRMLRALSARIGLSIALFALLLVSWHFGWIEPKG